MIKSVDELLKKKELLLEKQNELEKRKRAIVEIEKSIANLEQEIKTADFPYMVTIATWHVNYGDSWARAEKGTWLTDVTRKNAEKQLTVLHNTIEEIENLPFRIAEIFAEENKCAIREIKTTIKRIKANFDL